MQSAYDDGWQAGDNGGFGFQPWEFFNFFDPEFSPHAEAQFIATNEFVDVPSNGPAFGQTNGNRELWGYTAWATRPFESPLQVGQSFSIDLDNPVLAPLSRFDPSGVMLRFRDALDNVKFTLLAEEGFNNENWTVFDTSKKGINTRLSSTSSSQGGFNVELTITDTDAYQLTLTPFSDGEPFQVSGAFPSPGTPVSEVSVVMYSNGSSMDGSREFYANDLRITADLSKSLPGDANFDGSVDAADFNIWNENRLQEGTDWRTGDFNGDHITDDLDLAIWNYLKFGSEALPGDANYDGNVDATDFNIWNDNRSNAGTDWRTGDFNGDGMTDDLDLAIWNVHKFTSVPLMSTVPEPTMSCLLLLTMLCSVVVCRGWNSRRTKNSMN